jgi:hypothetical protein
MNEIEQRRTQHQPKHQFTEDRRQPDSLTQAPRQFRTDKDRCQHWKQFDRRLMFVHAQSFPPWGRMGNLPVSSVK